MRTARWRALAAEERSLPAFGAHLALDGRVRMNPLLGTGGNAGQRKFDRGWGKAVKRIEKPPRGQSRESLKVDIAAFLDGESCGYLGDFSAGSWFGAANKMYNHGTRRSYREGEITPWAMALACEGLLYFAGGVSRQLGNRRQPRGAFPFITAAMAPQGADEAGGIEAEVWAPIWDQPMTMPELRSLFLRGRAELGGRGATSSAAFAVGVTCRGVDAGISEFRRFLLLHTTSAQTFESRLATIVPVPKTNLDSTTTRTMRTIVEFHETLPADRKIRNRWRFAGLRGPLEQALVDFAATAQGAGHTEQAWALVDEMFAALVKVDQNRTFRGRNERFQLLPGAWATRLFQEDPPDRETRLALALSSLSGDAVLPAVHCAPHRRAEEDVRVTLGVPRITTGSPCLERCGVDRMICVRRQRDAPWKHRRKPRLSRHSALPSEWASTICIPGCPAIWTRSDCVSGWIASVYSTGAAKQTAKLLRNCSAVSPVIDQPSMVCWRSTRCFVRSQVIGCSAKSCKRVTFGPREHRHAPVLTASSRCCGVGM